MSSLQTYSRQDPPDLHDVGEIIVLNRLRQAGGGRKLVCFRFQSLMRHLVGAFTELIFKLRKM